MEHDTGDAATLFITLPHGTSRTEFSPNKIIHNGRFVRFVKHGRIYRRHLWIFRTYLSVPAARAYLTEPRESLVKKLIAYLTNKN